MSIGGGINHFLLLFFIYLVPACFFNRSKDFLEQLQNLKAYRSRHKSMVNKPGFFEFKAECYHYESRAGALTEESVKYVTHRVVERFEPKSCEDLSGRVGMLKDFGNYGYVQVNKWFYFEDAESVEKYNEAFKEFAARNKLDIYQEIEANFQVEGYQP